eukprot:TRINITY_DN21587_c0_g1_i1.p1 TRINITY_DN21587_c0_g1~~TRINITY_DN21587_c0_g1_i1.p1  ORF type:complete len:203 (+),score=25.90 TRINITY_DN21587_c0_g1_i1:60-611(+)
MYVAVWAFPILLEQYHGISVWIAGLLLIPYGIGTMVGSLFGGAAADSLREVWGSGGYLWPLCVGGGVVSVSLVVFGLAIPWNYYTVAVAVLAIILIGTFTTSGRSGLLSFCIERHPEKAAAVISGVLAFQYLVVIVQMTITAVILSAFKESMYGSAVAMTYASACIFLSLIPVLVLVRRAHTH